jgi:hypothetical protein
MAARSRDRQHGKEKPNKNKREKWGEAHCIPPASPPSHVPAYGPHLQHSKHGMTQFGSRWGPRSRRAVSSSSGVANTLDDRPPMVCQFKPPRASRDLLCTASSPRCARTATACTPRLLQNCATRDVRKEVTGAVPAAVGRPGRVGMCRRVAREKKARAKQNGQASPSTSTCQGCHLLCWQATRTPHNRPPRSPPPPSAIRF